MSYKYNIAVCLSYYSLRYLYLLYILKYSCYSLQKNWDSQRETNKMAHFTKNRYVQAYLSLF